MGLKLKSRHILMSVAVLALAVLVYLSWADFKEAFRLIGTANWWILVLAPLIQVLSFYCNTRYYQTFLGAFNYQLNLERTYKLSLAINFVNQVSPSAGITGATFLSYALKHDGVPSGKATLVQYGRYALTYVSYLILIVLALALVYFSGGINQIIVRVVLLVVGFGVLLSMAVLIALLSRSRLNATIFKLQRFVDRLSRWLRRGKPLVGKQRTKRLLQEFHHGSDVILAERKHLRMPFLWALMGNIMEVGTLYVVFVALGFAINPGSVIISYAAANSVSIFSVVPGDIGVFEVAMVAALTGTGVPVAVALGATLLYRILNKAIFLPIGFYFYSQFIRNNGFKKHIETNNLIG